MMAGEPGAPSTKPEAAAAAAVTPASALRLLRDPTTAAAAAAAPAPATARPRIQPSALTLLLCHATAAPAAPMLVLPPLLLLLLLVMLLLLIPLRKEDAIQLRGAAPAPAVAAPLPPRAATTRNIPWPATRMVDDDGGGGWFVQPEQISFNRLRLMLMTAVINQNSTPSVSFFHLQPNCHSTTQPTMNNTLR